MKKVLVVILLVVVIIASYLGDSEFSFSPLKENDFQKLFKGYSGSFDKSWSKDLLGLSTHREYFEIYKYNVENVIIDKNYPKLIEWENNKFNNETLVGKWKNCPLDSQVIELYKFALISNKLANVECCSSFSKEVSNPENYYSFVRFNDLEQYFLLYCANSQTLYYIRRKGF